MKKFISEILIKKRLKTINRNVKFFNLETCKNITILFNASDKNNYQQAKLFMTDMQQMGKKVTGFGYADKDQIETFYKTYTGFHFFCEKDFNFFYIPKSSLLSDFILEQPDILVDITMMDDVRINNLFILSKAKFKTGSLKARMNEYDFFIDLGNNNNPEGFLKQLKHYLLEIKTK